MAGESARFGLRVRPPTAAVRPFDLPPRLLSQVPFHSVPHRRAMISWQSSISFCCVRG
jgi:hypothetical protein